MKRLHVHVNVSDLEESIRFYTALFGNEPAKTKSDYAKWMLDDPLVNFAISTRGNNTGVDHLGIQTDDENELNEIRARLKQAELSVFDEGKTTCCYAVSEKTWARDPAGTVWETYHTMADAQIYGTSTEKNEVTAGQCCAPAA